MNISNVHFYPLSESVPAAYVPPVMIDVSQEPARMTIPPTVGRTVLYTLSTQDADMVNRRRADGIRAGGSHRGDSDGSQIHVGNKVTVGEVYPLIITRVWSDQPESLVNGQVMLDGNDTLWVTSVHQGTGPRTWAWPVKL